MSTRLAQQVLDDYIPHLRGIIACVQSDELQFKYEPGELSVPLSTERPIGALDQVAMMVPLTPPPSILLANDALCYIIQHLPAAPTTVPTGRSRKHPSRLCHGPLKLLSLRHRLARRVRIRTRDKRQREKRKRRETQLWSDAPL